MDISYKHWEYFSINILNDGHKKSLYIEVIVISGESNLYISKKYKRPNNTYYEWKSNEIGSDHYTFNNINGNTKYYIGINSISNTLNISSILITATISDSVDIGLHVYYLVYHKMVYYIILQHMEDIIKYMYQLIHQN